MRTTRTHSLRRLIATGLGCAALGVASIGVVAAPAGAATDGATGTGRHPGFHLTTEQKQCLADHGVTRPVRPLTREKIATIKAAVKACDIQVPAATKARLARLAKHRLHLTDADIQCLKDHGVSFPVRPLTREKIQTIRAAAQACDIHRPAAGATQG